MKVFLFQSDKEVIAIVADSQFTALETLKEFNPDNKVFIYMSSVNCTNGAYCSAFKFNKGFINSINNK